MNQIEIHCSRCGTNKLMEKSDNYGEHECFDGGVGTFIEYPTEKYKIPLVKTPVITQEQYKKLQEAVLAKAIERSNWINDQMKKYVPVWQRWLMLITQSTYLFKLFDWKIKTYKYDELNQDVIEIWHKDKLIVQKIFKA